MKDLAGIGEVMNSEVAKRAYDDAASGSFVEIGKLATDGVKTARLFLAPLQIAASFQTRFEKFLRKLENKVPEEHRIDSHPQICGPILESMRYVEESNELWDMFCELLSKSIDSRKVNLAHPSFAHILRQLSRDEALILAKLQNSKFVYEVTRDLMGQRFTNKKVIRSTLPIKELHNPDSFDIYNTHLTSLSLISWRVKKEDAIRDGSGLQTGIYEAHEVALTNFGSLFMEACTQLADETND